MKNLRWLTSTLDAAKTETPAMPWARGARRAEMIARRKAAAEVEAQDRAA